MRALRHARHVLTENPVTLGAFVLLLAFVLLALFGPTLAPYDPLASDAVRKLEAPSRQHWFGTGPSPTRCCRCCGPATAPD